jgi:hypothetical protein
MSLINPIYKLSVGSIFKNEEGAMVEWIEHYLFHGVDHFYLINDGSTDSSLAKLQPYMDKGLITLFNVECHYYLGRQRDLYTKHFLPHLKETEWLIIVDLDQFLWSPRSISLVKVLQQCSHLGQIQVRETLFNSNGHETQPKSIVAGFTEKNANTPISKDPSHAVDDYPLKYFVNSKFTFSSLNVHHALFEDRSYDTTHFLLINPDWFVCNHYICQSREFWNTIKCTRGDSDSFLTRKPEYFDTWFKYEEVEQDTRLLEQNRPMLERLGLL